jgi:hypothetical protein
MKTKGKSVESFAKERKEPKEINFFDKGIRNFFNIQMFPMENK